MTSEQLVQWLNANKGKLIIHNGKVTATVSNVAHHLEDDSLHVSLKPEDKPAFPSVCVDGVDYVPASTHINAEAMKLLRDVYWALSSETYDPLADSTYRFAKPLFDKMMLANKALGFSK
jgi:hypothetical protein